ncbi:MAG TPA: 4Fe-4S dicluster domain-containing protein, partial [Methanothermococcus okinawensis]|nr:4Fe-4S dicluster domain-containing protein [Methanothermococcus okinawensis]
MAVTIDYSKCKGVECGECVDVCPMEVFKIEGNRIIVANEDLCTFCMVCIDVCLEDAIEIKME